MVDRITVTIKKQILKQQYLKIKRKIHQARVKIFPDLGFCKGFLIGHDIESDLKE